jgi:hypothetical protein
VRLRHFNEIADVLFTYAGRRQIERREVQVGDVVVMSGSGRKLTWDSIGVVLDVIMFWDFWVWMACGRSNWWNMNVKNYGPVLGYVGGV